MNQKQKETQKYWDKFYQDKFKKALPKKVNVKEARNDFGEGLRTGWNDSRRVIKSNWNK